MEQQILIPLLIPLIILQIILMIIALRKWSKQESFRYLNKWIWFFIIILVQTIGPIIYLIIGSENERH